jgi:hypothetical protein
MEKLTNAMSSPDHLKRRTMISHPEGSNRRDFVRLSLLAGGAVLVAPNLSQAMPTCNIGAEQRRVFDCQEGNVPVQFEEVDLFFLVRIALATDGQTTIFYSELPGLLSIRQGENTLRLSQGVAHWIGSDTNREPESLLEPHKFAALIAWALRRTDLAAIATQLTRLMDAVNSARVTIVQQGGQTLPPPPPPPPPEPRRSLQDCLAECAQMFKECIEAADRRANDSLRSCERAHPDNPSEEAFCAHVAALRRLRAVGECERNQAQCIKDCTERFR